MGKHWIVLVNKSPRGPLTFEEVSALLNEKLISRTDLALAVSSEKSEEKSDWKFLWQYPEFDLRAQRAKTNPPPLDIKTEQRKVQNESEIQAKISSSLPEEIAMISPEDLIVSIKKLRPKGPAPLMVREKDEEDDSLPYSNAQPGNAKWGYAVLGLLILMVGGWIKSAFFEPSEIQSTKISTNIVRTPAKADVAVTVPKAKNVDKSKSGVVTRPNQLDKPKEVSQSATLPKRNEISIEEYQKMKEANAAKERAQEDEQQRLNEEAENLANTQATEAEEAEPEADDAERNIGHPIKPKFKKITVKDLKKRKVAGEGRELQESQEQEQEQANEGSANGDNSEAERDQERDRDRDRER
jgi:hypothetical protein